MKGRGLTASTLRALLEASYSGADNPIGNWKRDMELSSDTAHVYSNGQRAVVAHRGTEGTLDDWGNNLKYATTGEVGYKQTDRFKESKDVQKSAEDKYGADNVTTIGHSQGGLLAELLGKNSREIITVNKATSPFSDNTGGKNQYDIRSECDKVSMFRDPFKKQRKNDTVIKGKKNFLGQCKDSVAEHSYDILNRRDGVEIFGDKSLTGGRCWQGYKAVAGKKPYSKGSCIKGGLIGGIEHPGTFVREAGEYYFAPGNMSKQDVLKNKSQYRLPCGGETLATYSGYCPANKTCYAGYYPGQNGCQHWYDNAGKKISELWCDETKKNKWGGVDCENKVTTAPYPPADFKIATGTMQGGSALKSVGTFVKDAAEYYWAPGNMSKQDVLSHGSQYRLPCSGEQLATYMGYCPTNKTCYAGYYPNNSGGCQHWTGMPADFKIVEGRLDETEEERQEREQEEEKEEQKEFKERLKNTKKKFIGKGVSNYSKKKAESLGVDIKPSTKKGKKIDVFKDGKLVASIGAKGYKDYPTHLEEKGKEYADKRRKAYKMRHEKDRHTPGTPGFYADKILW